MTARIALAAACALAPTAAWSGSVCVDPAAPSCQPTIQAGIDAAGAGDLVQVAAGLYREQVIVPEFKTGLRLVGAGPRATIVDPGGPGNFTIAIWVRASGVEVRDLGIRGGSIGVIVNGLLSDVVLRGLRIVGLHSDGAVLASGPSARLQVVDNVIEGGGRAAIHIGFDSASSLVANNRITQSEFGILADSSPRSVIRDNQITMTSHTAIRATGDDLRVSGNVVIDANEFGLDVRGRNPVVEENRLRNVGQSRITCTPCSGGAVRGNVNHATQPRPIIDGIAFALNADAPGLLVEDNLVSRPGHYGFVLQGEGIRLEGNVVIEAPYAAGQAFRIHGEEHVLVGNASVRAGGIGFLVFDNGHVLEDNTSSGARVSGFQVAQATNTFLRRDVSVGSRSAGFSILPGAVSTGLEGNRAAGNRYDFCDDGVGTNVFGTQFATFSSVCDIT